MAFALPVWLAVQDQCLEHERAAPSCFDNFDDDALFQMFHLTRSCISFITDYVRIRIKSVPLDQRALPVDAMVMLALNFYAHGVSSASILQRVGLNQAESVINTVSGVIAGMSDQFISFPLTRNAKDGVAVRAEKMCGIPNVLGVMAPAHFRIRASPYDKNTFRPFINTLGYTSVASQIICDSDGNIMSVERCCVGRTFEQDMWEASSKGRELEKDLHGPYWIIGKMDKKIQKASSHAVVSDWTGCYSD